MGFTVWDFFHVMGGHNSILLWQKYGLANTDRIHYNGQGYMLQGDLLFNAILRQWDAYIDDKHNLKVQLSEQNESQISEGL
jgi:hypothetical protein